MGEMETYDRVSRVAWSPCVVGNFLELPNLTERPTPKRAIDRTRQNERQRRFAQHTGPPRSCRRGLGRSSVRRYYRRRTETVSTAHDSLLLERSRVRRSIFRGARPTTGKWPLRRCTKRNRW